MAEQRSVRGMSATQDAVEASQDGPAQSVVIPNPIWRAQISVAADTGFPRDRQVITPHFVSGTATAQQLADKLGAGMLTYLKASYDVTVNIYLEDWAPPGTPHPPLASGQYGTKGNTITSQSPREVALCLSYYAGVNAKRSRGRLYVPHTWIYRNSTSPNPAPATPTAADQTAAQNIWTQVLLPCYTTLSVIWVVASRADKNAKMVSAWWVDNEWDTQRRRGMKSTARTTGITGQSYTP